jgi:hypothetical protein
MPQSPAWPRRCVYRFGKSIQRGRKDIDRQIAEAEAQNGGGLSKPSTVTDLKIRRWESRPKAGNSSLIKSVRVQAKAAQRSAIGISRRCVSSHQALPEARWLDAILVFGLRWVTARGFLQKAS